MRRRLFSMMLVLSLFCLSARAEIDLSTQSPQPTSTPAPVELSGTAQLTKLEVEVFPRVR